LRLFLRKNGPNSRFQIHGIGKTASGVMKIKHGNIFLLSGDNSKFSRLFFSIPQNGRITPHEIRAKANSIASGRKYGLYEAVKW